MSSPNKYGSDLSKAQVVFPVASKDAMAMVIVEGSKTVTSITVPEVLGSGTCIELFLFPLRTNTGAVFWGSSATDALQHGVIPVVITAPPGKAINLATIYLDVAVAGEGVRFVATS